MRTLLAGVMLMVAGVGVAQGGEAGARSVPQREAVDAKRGVGGSEMTNLIGMALIILNVETVDIVATNDLEWISCASAGCTNTEGHLWIHTTQTVEVVGTRRIVTVGTREARREYDRYMEGVDNLLTVKGITVVDTPLYRIVTQESDGKTHRCVLYHNMTWVEGVKP